MLARFHDISTWVTLMAILLTPLMGSGVMVYCVGPDDHATIEFAHGEQPCDRPADGEDKAPEADWVNVAFASECDDQPLAEAATVSLVSTPSKLVVASPASLLYLLSDPEELQPSLIFSRWQDTHVHPDMSVVQSVILLI